MPWRTKVTSVIGSGKAMLTAIAVVAASGSVKQTTTGLMRVINRDVSTPGNFSGVNLNTGRSEIVSCCWNRKGPEARFRTLDTRVSYFAEASRVSSVAVTF